MQDRRQQHPQDELRKARDEHGSPQPEVQGVLEDIDADRAGRQADHKGSEQEAAAPPPGLQVPKGRVESIELDQEADEPPGWRERIVGGPGEANAEETQEKAAPQGGSAQDPEEEDHPVNAPPHRVEPLPSLHEERHPRQDRSGSPLQQTPRQPEAAGDQEQLNSLIAGPPDVSDQIQRNSPSPVPLEGDELAEAFGQRRPAGHGIAEVGASQNSFDRVIEEDPDQGDALDPVDPAETGSLRGRRRSGGPLGSG